MCKSLYKAGAAVVGNVDVVTVDRCVNHCIKQVLLLLAMLILHKKTCI